MIFSISICFFFLQSNFLFWLSHTYYVDVTGWYAELDGVESDRTVSYLIENQWKLSQSNQPLCPDDDYIDGFCVLFRMQTRKYRRENKNHCNWRWLLFCITWYSLLVLLCDKIFKMKFQRRTGINDMQRRRKWKWNVQIEWKRFWKHNQNECVSRCVSIYSNQLSLFSSLLSFFFRFQVPRASIFIIQNEWNRFEKIGFDCEQ